ncbi:Lsd1/2 complex PHD finger containing protein Phf2 [Homalodisca vitripennis]|nr:Lsd1/2 complex PHD finger containing protein Phf2 [Homalodisca vitripennis]
MEFGEYRIIDLTSICLIRTGVKILGSWLDRFYFPVVCSVVSSRRKISDLVFLFKLVTEYVGYLSLLVKKQNNWHRHNYTDKDADSKPVQTGTPVFIQELKTRHFPSADPVVTRLTGSQLTVAHLYQNGFEQPIMVEEKDGLDIRVPSEYFTVQDVEALVGSDREVDVIDVARQADIRMRVCDFVNYFNNPMRQRVLNLISLEFSTTKLSELVEAPLVARKLDWVNTVWPMSIGTLQTVCKRPEVQKYCLIGVKDSYTDFHIDFGGTSVWYHVLRCFNPLPLARHESARPPHSHCSLNGTDRHALLYPLEPISAALDRTLCDNEIDLVISTDCDDSSECSDVPEPCEVVGGIEDVVRSDNSGSGSDGEPDNDLHQVTAQQTTPCHRRPAVRVPPPCELIEVRSTVSAWKQCERERVNFALTVEEQYSSLADYSFPTV